MLGTVKAVVFDLDDTLYPEVAYVRSGLGAVAEWLGGEKGEVKGVFEMMWAEFQRGERRRVFNAVLERLGRDAGEAAVGELVRRYREHRPKLVLEEAVGEMLGRLKGRFKLGLITDGYMPGQRLKVEALGLVGVFDGVIYTEELGREYWKPSERAFGLMEEKLGAKGAECVYVADNVGKDFVGARRRGWRTVQVRRADRVCRVVETAAGGAAEVVIGEVTEVERLLS